MEGNLNEVKRLVGICIAETRGRKSSSSLPSYVNAVDASGNAAIHGAVFSGHLEVLAFLVESCDASLTIKNGLGCSPLWIAAGYNKLDCLNYLIDKLHDNNQLEAALLEDGKNNSGDTPFLAAASKGNVTACESLLRAVEKCSQNDDVCLSMKAKILRTANDAGDTPLKVAVATSQGEEMLKFLLQVDDAIVCVPNQYGESPATSEDGEVPLEATLRRSNRSERHSYSDDEETILLCTCVNRKNKLGLSPLIVACERNLPSVAELLLAHGADMCIQDPKGRNCLSVAAFCGCNDVIEFLLNQTTTKSLLLDQKDENGCTPVWLAARTGNLSVVKLLMDAGADATIKDNEGLSPQDVAVKFTKAKVEEYFSQEHN